MFLSFLLIPFLFFVGNRDMLRSYLSKKERKKDTFLIGIASHHNSNSALPGVAGSLSFELLYLQKSSFKRILFKFFSNFTSYVR